MRRILLATGNPHKVAELRDLLGAAVEVATPASLGIAFEVVEDGATFAANASRKAEALCDLTGEVCVADDSGLCVDALQGAPGVRSARFAADAGEGHGDAANRARLLQLLTAVSDGDRRAHFACAIAVAAPGRPTRVFEGRCEGRITRAPRGTSGFGYDPLFESHDGRTFAEMPLEEKQPRSHRGHALRAAAPYIMEQLAEPGSDKGTT